MMQEYNLLSTPMPDRSCVLILLTPSKSRWARADNRPITTLVKFPEAKPRHHYWTLYFISPHPTMAGLIIIIDWLYT